MTLYCPSHLELSLADQTSFRPLSEGGKESGHYGQDFMTRRNAAINRGHMTATIAVVTAATAAHLTLNLDSQWESTTAAETTATSQRFDILALAYAARDLDPAGQTPPLMYYYMTMHYNY